MEMEGRKVRSVETVYPPEFHESVKLLYELIQQAYADIDQITGLNDPALTATAMIDYSTQREKVEAITYHIRQLQGEVVRRMASFMPQTIIHLEPSP